MSIFKRLGNLGRGWARTLGTQSTPTTQAPETIAPVQNEPTTRHVAKETAEASPRPESENSSTNNLPPDETPTIKRTL